MVHHEDGPLLDGQAPEAALQLVAVGQVAWPRRRVPPGRGAAGGPRPSAGARRRDFVVAGVDQQALEPGVEAVGVAQAADVAPGADEALLDRVLAAVGVAQDPMRQREEPVVGGAREHVERLVVAALCPLDQVTLHRRSAMEGRLPASPSIDGRDARIDSIFVGGLGYVTSSAAQPADAGDPRGGFMESG